MNFIRLTMEIGDGVSYIHVNVAHICVVMKMPKDHETKTATAIAIVDSPVLHVFETVDEVMAMINRRTH